MGRIGFRCALALTFLCPAVAGELAAPHSIPPSPANFRQKMPRTIRADHPAIVPVAEAIRAVSSNPLAQLVMVNDVTHLLVDYDEDQRVYGVIDFHATLDEMLARRRQEGWLYLRDDCDGRAVFAAHLLAALGIPWRLEASTWKRHAWVVGRVNGVDYDLLDLPADHTATHRLSFKLFGRWVTRASRQPPLINWRTLWAERTRRDVNVGLRLGLLTLDSTPDHQRQRYSTDWTLKAPGGLTSPADGRAIGVKCAGFPYGEALDLIATAERPIGSDIETYASRPTATTSAATTTPER